jgi:hypothetical protein
MISGFKSVWDWAGANIVDPLVTGVINSFGWVQDNVIKPFKAVMDNLFNFSFPKIPIPEWIDDFKGIVNKLSNFSWPKMPSAGKASSWWPFAEGGMVYAAGGTFVPKGTDTVPAMLTPGEFVVNRGAVSSLGINAMKQINNGQLPGTAGNTQVTVNLDIKTTEAIDESFVRAKLIPRIKEEIRRASLDGAFIVSASGVRS